MGQARPDIPASELSALVRAVRAAGRDRAISPRNQNLRAATLAFAVILIGILHSAPGRAWNSPQAHFRAEEELKMFGAMRTLVMSSSLIAASGALAQNAVEWRVQDGGNGHWYSLVVSSSPLSWGTAQSACEARGGHLATIRSEAEDIFVFSLANTPSAWNGHLGPWLGGRQILGTGEPVGVWEWVTGEPWGYVGPDETFSNNGGPPGTDENRLHYIDFIRRWNDIPEDGYKGVRSYIIEWSADCNGDGIVDYGQCRDGSLPDYNGNNIPDCCEAGTPCVVGNYPVQWRIADGGNGHWYLAADAATGDIALTVASSRGGNLATITSAGENAIVKRLFLATGRSWAWLGLRQLSGQSTPNAGWYWVTGEPFQYLNWTDHNGAFPTGAPDDSPCALPPWGVENDQANQGVMDPTGRWDDLETGLPTCGAPVWNNIAIIEWSADCNNDGLVDYGQILTGQLADTNQNGIPDTCEVDPCPGDITGNGSVTGIDLAAVLAAWGTDGQSKFDCDVNDDGTVDGNDLAIVLSSWGPCP